MTVSKELQDKVEARLTDFMNHIETKLGREFNRPTVTYDLTGTTGGTAYGSKNLIKLNRVLMNTHTEEMIEDTLPHELGHIIVRQMHGNETRWNGRKHIRVVKPHGAEWKSVMAAMGTNASRCHSMAVTPSRQQNRIAYSCSCKDWDFTTTRHNKIVRKGKQYSCPTCRVRITIGKLNGAQPTIKPKLKPATRSSRTHHAKKRTGGLSKKAQAQAIYDTLMAQSKPRTAIVTAFKTQLNMTQAGANTYYYNCQKAAS